MTISPLDMALSQFPEYKEAISTLYSDDEDFKTLCDDYYISKTNIEKFRQSSSRDPNLEMEYKLLAEDLRKEILEYIERLENSHQ